MKSVLSWLKFEVEMPPAAARSEEREFCATKAAGVLSFPAADRPSAGTRRNNALLRVAKAGKADRKPHMGAARYPGCGRRF